MSAIGAQSFLKRQRCDAGQMSAGVNGHAGRGAFLLQGRTSMSSSTRRLAFAFNALLDKAMACCGKSVRGKARLVGPLTIARLLMAGAAMTAVVAQGEPPGDQSNADLTVEQVRRTAREAEARKDIDAPTKARIAELSRTALADLERVPELRAQAESYRQLMRDAPTQTRDLERQLQRLRTMPEQVAPTADNSSSLDDLEHTLDQA